MIPKKAPPKPPYCPKAGLIGTNTKGKQKKTKTQDETKKRKVRQDKTRTNIRK